MVDHTRGQPEMSKPITERPVKHLAAIAAHRDELEAEVRELEFDCDQHKATIRRQSDEIAALTAARKDWADRSIMTAWGPMTKGGFEYLIGIEKENAALKALLCDLGGGPVAIYGTDTPECVKPEPLTERPIEWTAVYEAFSACVPDDQPKTIGEVMGQHSSVTYVDGKRMVRCDKFLLEEGSEDHKAWLAAKAEQKR
jgi:hypothetical protein